MVGGGTAIKLAIEKFGKNNASVMAGVVRHEELPGGGAVSETRVYEVD